MDGNTVSGRSSKLNVVPPLRVGPTLAPSGGVGAPVQGTACAATHGRLAHLSPAAEPTEPQVSQQPLFSLCAPSPYSPDPQEGKTDAEPSACLPSSPPRCASATACAPAGSVCVWAAVSPPPGPGLAVRKAEAGRCPLGPGHRPRGTAGGPPGPQAGPPLQRAGLAG